MSYYNNIMFRRRVDSANPLRYNLSEFNEATGLST